MIALMKRFSLLAFFMTFLSLGAAFAAQAAAIPDDQVKERLNFVQSALLKAQPRAKTWLYGWVAGFSAATVAQGTLAAVHWNDTKTEGLVTVRDRDFAQDMLVGGGTTALGVVGMLVDPFVPACRPNALTAIPENSPEERRAKLERAEAILRECADREKRGRGLMTHLLNLGVNAAAGIVTAAAFHRPWTDGLVTFGAGEAVSLLNIFTQLTQAIRDLKNYEAKYSGKPGTYAAVPGAPSDRHWAFGVWPGGISVYLGF